MGGCVNGNGVKVGGGEDVFLLCVLEFRVEVQFLFIYDLGSFWVTRGFRVLERGYSFFRFCESLGQADSRCQWLGFQIRGVGGRGWGLGWSLVWGLFLQFFDFCGFSCDF